MLKSAWWCNPDIRLHDSEVYFPENERRLVCIVKSEFGQVMQSL